MEKLWFCRFQTRYYSGFPILFSALQPCVDIPWAVLVRDKLWFGMFFAPIANIAKTNFCNNFVAKNCWKKFWLFLECCKLKCCELFGQIWIVAKANCWKQKPMDGWEGWDGNQKCPFNFSILWYIRHYNQIYLYIYIYKKCPG